MRQKILKKRSNKIRRVLNKKKAECLILTGEANVSYVTGFSGSDSWALLTGRGAYLLTDGRYAEQAENECPLCTIVSRKGTMADAVNKVLKRYKKIGAVHIEKNVSLSAFEKLKQDLKVKVTKAEDFIEPLREIKDDSEVKTLRRGIGIATEALERAKRYLTAGISENELAGLLELEIRRCGGTRSFETIVAFGANASRPHHQPGGRKLKKNDTVLIDFGVRHKGYCCDLTRCFAVGEVSPLYKKAYSAVQKSQEAAVKKIRAGVDCRELDSYTKKVIQDAGLPPHPHGTGHGLGLEVHEKPVISHRSQGKLQAGMVCTIEPGIYIPGKLGIRLEDDILVTEKGCRILSRCCPHEKNLV